MILTFPIAEASIWLAKEIKVNKGDTIVINEVNLKYFMLGNQDVDFINTFPEKEKIFLLTD